MYKKWKKREERTEKGMIISTVIFLILFPLGLFLDNDILMIIGVLFVFYLPGIVVVYVIWAVSDEFEKWKKKRRRAKRYAEIRSAEVVVCKACDKIYNRDELDLSPSEEPRCPICNKLLKIKE